MNSPDPSSSSRRGPGPASRKASERTPGRAAKSGPPSAGGAPRPGPVRAPRRGAEAGPFAAAPGAPPAGGEGALVRLNKRMADLGLCSRREADAWIAQGWVRVNGQVAGMGVKVSAADAIAVDRQARSQQARQVTILLHKPVGYVSGQAEDGHLPAVTLVRAANHWPGDPSRQRFEPGQLRGLAPAGRLDIDSVGLLVLTQDGRVARQLIGEDSGVDKEYLVRVHYGEVAQDVQAVFPLALLDRLRHGLVLDGQQLKPARVEWQNPEQLRFVLNEGKKRQIRRMCEQVGLKVVGLKRIRMGQVALGRLPPGMWRYLGDDECF